MFVNPGKLFFGTSDEAKTTFTDRWRARELGHLSRLNPSEALLSEAHSVY